MMKERQQAYKSMREVQGGKAERSDVQALDTEYPSWCGILIQESSLGPVKVKIFLGRTVPSDKKYSSSLSGD